MDNDITNSEDFRAYKVAEIADMPGIGMTKTR